MVEKDLLVRNEREAFRKAVLENNIRMILNDARYVLDHLEEFEEV